MIYTCTEEERKTIQDYAYAVDQKRMIRNKINKDSGTHRPIREMVGKIGEVAASKFYGGKVDFSLYENNTFGHDPDLNKTDFVKTCSLEEAKRFGLSWLFDKGDDLIRRPSDGQRVIFVCVDQPNWSARVYGYVYATKLNGRIGPARTLRHKVAVWYDDFRLTSPNGDCKFYKGVKEIIETSSCIDIPVE